MSVSSTDVDRLLYLVDAVCSKTASDDELAELDAILLADGTSHSHSWTIAGCTSPRAGVSNAIGGSEGV